jgi:hypothetical protein
MKIVRCTSQIYDYSFPPSLLTDGHGKRVEKVVEFGWMIGEERERFM